MESMCLSGIGYHDPHICVFTLGQLLLTAVNYLYREVERPRPFFGYTTAPLQVVVFAMSGVAKEYGAILLGGLLAFGCVISLSTQPS
jgi:hypothetical protein